jgi:hypothetical protein
MGRYGSDMVAGATKNMSFCKRLAMSAVLAFLAPLSACSFGLGPSDIRVTSVTEVDFKDQSQFEPVVSSPRPSKLIQRIDFTTNTELLAVSVLPAHLSHIE